MSFQSHSSTYHHPGGSETPLFHHQIKPFIRRKTSKLSSDWVKPVWRVRKFAHCIEGLSMSSRVYPHIDVPLHPFWAQVMERLSLNKDPSGLDPALGETTCQDEGTGETEELRINERPSHRISEYKKKQKVLIRQPPTHGSIHKRYKRQPEPPKLQTNCTMGGATLEPFDEPKTNLHQLSTDDMAYQRNVHGQLSLKFWKRTAGRSKSWKRTPKSKVAKQAHEHQLRRSLAVLEYQFSKSLLWFPIVFLRSQVAKKSPGLGRVVRHQDSDSVSKRVRKYDPHVHSFEEAPMVALNQYSNLKTTQDTEIRASGITMVEDFSQEPPSAFMRFTWKDKILTNGVGKLDRFLPTGMIFRNHWRVIGFLRNDSFADVYSLSNASLACSLATKESSHEAHVFLDEYHGNCAVYARRLRNRMLQREECLDTFVYGSRQVVIMSIQQKPLKFILRNTKEEFPILVDQIKCNEQIALQRRHFRGKPSFAAVAGERWPGTNSDDQAVPTSERKSALEKELGNIEKTRLKKAQKQRLKRQMQRDQRATMKLHSVRESLPQSVM